MLPVLVLVLPVGQLMQEEPDVAATMSEYLPASHDPHEDASVAPGVCENFPLPHAEQVSPAGP